MENKIHLVECPRDAMQGWKHIIPTHKKVEYLNALLKVGFDTMILAVLFQPMPFLKWQIQNRSVGQLSLENSRSKLLAIVANVRGAEEAIEFKEISYMGFPFSISETFSAEKYHSSIEQSLERVKVIQNLCVKHNKILGGLYFYGIWQSVWRSL
jgi:hydroxymethylglutaryl-CoA lyase